MGLGKNWKGKGEAMPQKGYLDNNFQGKNNKWDNGPPRAMAEMMEEKKEEAQLKATTQRLKIAEYSLQGMKGQEEALKSV
eukprot:1522118-Heterocapsa_arctica.AAC.1